MADYTIFPSILPSEDRNVVTDVVDIKAVLDSGRCPWCERDGFERPEMHARQAHPSQWAQYTEE